MTDIGSEYHAAKPTQYQGTQLVKAILAGAKNWAAGFKLWIPASSAPTKDVLTAAANIERLIMTAKSTPTKAGPTQATKDLILAELRAARRGNEKNRLMRRNPGPMLNHRF